MRTETTDKWVRAFVGDTAVVDSRAPMLFYEDTFPVPGYAFADQDVRPDLLRPSDEPPPRKPFFHLPKGPVRQWYDIEVNGRRIRHAAWRRDDPAIADRLVLSWQPGVLDRWMEEDEEVVEHPRDPHRRVEAIASSRHVQISLDGVALVDTRRPVLLFETGLPTRYYVPKSDVRFDALEPSGTAAGARTRDRPTTSGACATAPMPSTSPGPTRRRAQLSARSPGWWPSTTRWWTSRSTASPRSGL